jgi:hypothetical protein
MLGKVLAAALVFVVVSQAVGWAAGASVSGATIAAGADNDLLCDEDGVTVTYTLVGSSVTHSLVSGIDADCKGATLVATWDVFPAGPSLNDQGLLVGSLSSTSAQKTFSPAIAVTDLLGVVITIFGNDDE